MWRVYPLSFGWVRSTIVAAPFASLGLPLNLLGNFQRHRTVFHRSHPSDKVTTTAGKSSNFGVTALPK